MIEAVLKMPRLGETMEEGIIVGWLVDAGENFVRGDPIVEVETDKSVVEFPALGDGKLKEKVAHEGDLVKVGAPIANIDIAGELDWTKEDEEPEKPAAKQVREQVGQEINASLVAATARDGVVRQNGPLRATPEARRLAHLNGIELGSVYGSDRRGRIQKSDVEAVLNADRLAGADAGIAFSHDIAYVSVGPKGARPILLVHGFAADHTSYAALARILARAGRRVYAIDLPGHGATRLQANDLDDLSANLVEFVATIIGDQPFDLVAHSVGAVPALALAANPGVALNSLTLIAPAGMGHKIDAGFILSMAEPSSSGELARLLRRLSARHGALSPEALDALYRDLKRGRLRALADDLAERPTGRPEQRVDIIAALKKLAAGLPVSVLVGHKDKIINWRDVFLLPPSIGVHHFIEAGHMPHWDQTSDVAAIIVKGGDK